MKQQLAVKNPAGVSGKGGVAVTNGNGAKAAAASKSGRISMVIQTIPPFKPRGQAQDSNSATNNNNNNGGAAGKNGPTKTQTLPPGTHPHLGAGSAPGNGVPMSPTTANRLNVNASSFRPTGRKSPPVSFSIHSVLVPASGTQAWLLIWVIYIGVSYCIAQTEAHGCRARTECVLRKPTP